MEGEVLGHMARRHRVSWDILREPALRPLVCVDFSAGFLPPERQVISMLPLQR